MKAQVFTDKFAIGLSILCTAHCLILPILLAILPSIGALQLQDEAFHTWMIITVIPTSIYALSLGCKKHHSYRLFFWAVLGLILLAAAAFLDHSLLGEVGEKVLTLVGSVLIASVHLFNYKLCSQHKDCEH